MRAIINLESTAGVAFFHSVLRFQTIHVLCKFDVNYNLWFFINWLLLRVRLLLILNSLKVLNDNFYLFICAFYLLALIFFDCFYRTIFVMDICLFR